MLILERPWTLQPQTVVGVNLSNPLTMGLVSAWVPALAPVVITGTASLTPGPRGVGFLAAETGTNYGQISKVPQIHTLASWTIAAVSQVKSGLAWAINARSVASLTAPSRGIRLSVCHQVIGVNKAYFVHQGASGVFELAGTTVINDGQMHVLAGSRLSTTDHRLFVDGKQENSTGSSVTPSSTEPTFDIGGISGVTTTGGAGPIYLVATWSRALSEIEHRLFAENPWQLFAPQQIIIPTAVAASSLPTLSASTYVPGSITATGWRPRVTATY